MRSLVALPISCHRNYCRAAAFSLPHRLHGAPTARISRTATGHRRHRGGRRCRHLCRGRRLRSPAHITMHFVVCGLHMRGGPLTHQLTSAGGVFLRDAFSVPHYTLHVLSPVAPAVGPAKPGMLYHPPAGGGTAADDTTTSAVAAAAAATPANPATTATAVPTALSPTPIVGAIAVEVWDIPDAAIGGLLAGVPPPLAFGSVRLAAAASPSGVEVLKGFVCEGWVARDGVSDGVAFTDITHHGGWRAYVASLQKGDS